MRVVVCIKQILDPQTIHVSRSREMLDLRRAQKTFNPPDKHALEAALQLKDAQGAEVVAISLGEPAADDVLREALAMGADRAILLSDELLQRADATGVTRAMAAAVERLGAVDLVLTGAYAADTGDGQIAPRLAEALGWPVVLNAATPPATLPAVAAIAPTANKPRYPHGARIMNAYREWSVETWTSADLGLDEEALAPQTEARGLRLLPERELGTKLSGTPDEAAAELVMQLRARKLI